MNWTKEKIRQLRQRMGWSPAELALRLNVDPQRVVALEDGTLAPYIHEQAYFTLLESHADMAAEETSLAPAAEDLLQHSEMQQVHLFDLKI